MYNEASETTKQFIDKYIYLTKDVIPRMANDKEHRWPVKYDHCFQRIVLDNVCSGVWYDYIKRPAYKHLSLLEAQSAVALCEKIISGELNLYRLNAKSLNWRQKQTPQY